MPAPVMAAKRVVVIGAGMAGLTAGRRLTEAGWDVTLLDKGRRAGGRMATRNLDGGARADHGAQFFTVRSDEFQEEVDRWSAEGAVREWCRGFDGDDGHPRYAAVGGMAELAARMAWESRAQVRVSVHVEAVRRDGGWTVSWPARHGAAGGSLTADAVVLTAPVPQSAGLLDEDFGLPAIRYSPTVSLAVGLDGPPAVPPPGGVQVADDPVWSWIGDNQAKGTSSAPAVTLHTREDVAAGRWDDDRERLEADLLDAAAPWLGGRRVLSQALHRWRYATPVEPWPERCFVAAGGSLVVAGDAFGGPRVEGAYLSGRAASETLLA